MPVCKNIRVKGFIQRVSYRTHTKRIADNLGVNGWVRNLANGDVEACLEGDESAVDALLAWCAFGPKLGRVDEVLVTNDNYRGTFTEFSIITSNQGGED
ncbi:MAG: acylphosphatase [Oryzomonas sp.]|uniref:acylphosphatase n=1 Tax=Oryzomonas sp. TaxID=2855186 RepID=UPI0028457DAF|nr:acylphosphatase [Oryzomonas sp.]MDR3579817.1 acylphosphatase [Oryzomonas sp.]